MEKIDLGMTGRKTTRLGYGCSSLMGAMGRKESLAKLEAVFDAGVRHFDVAPMYGFGEAESCLGEFLERHRTEITVTTKFGIPPPKHQEWIRMARKVVGPIVRTLPGLKKRLANVANNAVIHEPKACFTASAALESLERSLKELRTDYIDVWLLHDVAASDLHDEKLLRLMENMVRTGKIGTFGVGTDYEKVTVLMSEHPKYCRTLQFEWSVFNEPVKINAFRMHHRSLMRNLQDLHTLLEREESLCKKWSEEIGANVSDVKVLAALMLKSALLENPQSVILFSSKSPSHIRQNVKAAEDQLLDEQARRLYAVVQRDMRLNFPGRRAVE